MASSLLRALVGSTPSVSSTWFAAGGVSIDFDKTLLAQALLFVVLIMVLSPLVFRPLLALFEERERRTEGTRAEAREMQRRAADLLTRYERELESKQRVAAVERERIRVETLRLEARILEEGRKATAQVVDQGREQISRETAQIRAALDTQLAELSRQVARRALGREVD